MWCMSAGARCASFGPAAARSPATAAPRLGRRAAGPPRWPAAGLGLPLEAGSVLRSITGSSSGSVSAITCAGCPSTAANVVRSTSWRRRSRPGVPQRPRSRPPLQAYGFAGCCRGDCPAPTDRETKPLLGKGQRSRWRSPARGSIRLRGASVDSLSLKRCGLTGYCSLLDHYSELRDGGRLKEEAQG